MAQNSWLKNVCTVSVPMYNFWAVIEHKKTWAVMWNVFANCQCRHSNSFFVDIAWWRSQISLWFVLPVVSLVLGRMLQKKRTLSSFDSLRSGVSHLSEVGYNRHALKVANQTTTRVAFTQPIAHSERVYYGVQFHSSRGFQAPAAINSESWVTPGLWALGFALTPP